MSQWRNSPTNYGAISQIFHWLMAFFVLAMLALGWGRDYAPGSWKPLLLQTHTGTGIAVLILLFLRLLWRAFNHPPKPIASFSASIKMAAHIMHWLLYAMLFLMPLSGWAMVSAMGRQPSFFGLFELPSLLQKTPSLVPLLKIVHNFMAYGFLILIAMHIAAALIHHFVYRDETLARMWPPARKNFFQK